MGYGTYSSTAYTQTTQARSIMSQRQVFRNSMIDGSMSPFGVELRESRDSEEHPKSLPIAVFLDVTGSMGFIPEMLAKGDLVKLMDTVIDHGVEHPQLFFGAIGDHMYDIAPLQIGQFESDHEKFDQWLTKVWIERGGGGNWGESYPLAWIFANKTFQTDAWDKRQKKGYLFTIGDEAPLMNYPNRVTQAVLGSGDHPDIRQILDTLKERWHIFHIHVQDGSYRNSRYVIRAWRELLGNHLILAESVDVAEIIGTIVSKMEGGNPQQILGSMNKNCASRVREALKDID